MKNIIKKSLGLCILVITFQQAVAQSNPIAEFNFDGSTKSIDDNFTLQSSAKVSYAKGISGRSLSIKSDASSGCLSLPGNAFQTSPDKDFSIQFWIKTTMDSKKPAVILSQKDFHNNSLASQKNAGWVLYYYGGTWAWNIGSGKRRVTHERDNGKYQLLNDGKWHQITMTYNAAESVIRLFYDGDNKALYNVGDSVGFNFSNTDPLIIGSDELSQNLQNGILKNIETGAENLQQLVDAYNRLGLNKLNAGEFEDLIVNPKGLFDREVNKIKLLKGADSGRFLQSVKNMDLKPVMRARSALMRNPYTTYQVADFLTVAPLLKIYSLENGKIAINQNEAKKYTKSEKLYKPDFDMDNLAIWSRTISPQEVLHSYAKYSKPEIPALKQKLSAFTAAEWNIHHGGIHMTIKKDGVDGRVHIADILKKENPDVIMMSETYSNGDFIAAQLGYYFATTIDWDYLNQGANISVLSRYPIKELYVPKGSPFMNVVVKVAISKTQDMYVMSNWYGMNRFPEVLAFNKNRFNQSDTIPTLFSGDFNSIPDIDGGKNNLASRKLLSIGFTDAYRSLHPDVKKYPGYTFVTGIRIDQLYYKGKGLKNTSTNIISSWNGGWPSDHFMTLSRFDLDYTTR